MRCPYCNTDNDRVIDSRSAADGFSFRRRRECIDCGRRFTTYERMEETPLRVVKKDGSRVPFDRGQILKGMLKACEKRPVSTCASPRCTASSRTSSSSSTNSNPSSRRTSRSPGAVRVRKRDGHEESCDELRLQESLERALRAVGDHLPWARQFRECVLLGLDADGVVATERLAGNCVAVLQRFGCHAASEAYLAYREAELAARSALRVHVPAAGGPRSAPWDRARLQLGLQRDRYLERAVARQVARRVERRLTAMGQRHVTARLVAALADNECRVLGLAHAALGAERIGPERRHLRAWLSGDCVPAEGMPSVGPEQGDVRPLLGGELLSAFALEELLPSATVDAREAGRIELLGLGEWSRPLAVRLWRAAEESEEGFWKRVGDSAGRAAEVQVEVGMNSGALGRTAPRWLRAGGAPLRLLTDDAALAADWAADGLWPTLTAAAWASADAATLERLLASQGARIAWAPKRARLAASAESAAPARSDTLHGAAVLNLARAAADAGPWGEREFLALVGDAARHACVGLAKLLERSCAGARPRVQLLPAGLPEALRGLFPDPALGEARVRPLLLALRDSLERAARGAGLRADTGRPPRGQGAGTRLADRDGLPGAPSLPLGWLPDLHPSAAAVRAGLAAAPWLEFPLTEVHGAAWADLLRPHPAARGA